MQPRAILMHKHCTLSSFEVPHKCKCIKLKMKSKITVNKFGERKVGSGVNHRPAYAYLPNALLFFKYDIWGKEDLNPERLCWKHQEVPLELQGF